MYRPAEQPGLPLLEPACVPPDEFYQRFLEKNQPAMIRGIAREWRATRDWVDKDGKPNLEFLRTRFGSSVVQVEPCGESSAALKRMRMTVSDFCEYWQGMMSSRSSLGGDSQANGQVLYLKDWHCAAEYPNYQGYSTPSYFGDDWLNRYYDRVGTSNKARPDIHDDCVQCSSRQSHDAEISDYRFVYCGPPGSRTGMHTDVLKSYSWSVNICGKKRWIMVRPEEEYCLRARRSPSQLIEDVEEYVLGRLSAEEYAEILDQYPALYDLHPIVVEQGVGDAIFVPSGWWHQVTNLDDTISINHNWIGAPALKYTVSYLIRERVSAAESIADCQQVLKRQRLQLSRKQTLTDEDMECVIHSFQDLVEQNLKANAGLNFADFVDLLEIGLEHYKESEGGCRRERGSGQNGKGALDFLTLSLVVRHVLVAAESMAQFSAGITYLRHETSRLREMIESCRRLLLVER